MCNLTELVLANVAISSSIVSVASNLPNLRVLSLEVVCIASADVEKFRDDIQVQHVRLVKICWHGRKRDGNVIWACKKLRTLEVSWDKKWKDVNKSCEKWSNVTCESMKIYSNCRLKSKEVDETTLSVGGVTAMEVNVFTSDKEILCRMLGALNNIWKLKVHICDDVNDMDDVLESVADMLDFNPPIEKLIITANDTLRTNITHEHFRKFKQLCGGLQHIGIGDRV
ncbi:hypothetical protein EV368DRAFT_69697 [Lentinula lateritia]|nr:hypothetical protein EV368DRAFT_69697 [Lentinula lateritia]